MSNFKTNTGLRYIIIISDKHASIMMSLRAKMTPHISKCCHLESPILDFKKNLNKPKHLQNGFKISGKI